MMFICLFGCQKPTDNPPENSTPVNPPVLSKEKIITAFTLTPEDNTGLTSIVSGAISTDSIILLVPDGTNVTNLKPTVTFSGKSMSPASKTAQSFSTVITYTVTAEDGTTKNYVVEVRRLKSSEKSITSFVFDIAENPALQSQVRGSIRNDSILLTFPFGTSLNGLRPKVTYAGETVTPTTLAAQDFSIPVIYTVTAQDQTKKEYRVFANTEGQPGTIFINTTYADFVPTAVAGKVYAIDASTGKARWSYIPNGGSFFATPAFSEGVLYTADWNKILAIDTVSKTHKWQYTTPGAVKSAIAVKKGTLYANCDDGYLYALNASTGTLKWRFEQSIRDTLPSNLSSPTIVDGVVYFGSSRDSYIYAVDANTGMLRWKIYNTHAMGATANSSPSVVNGMLYMGDNYHNILALDATNGQIKWVFTANGLVFSSPTVVNGMVYVGSTGGSLYALDAVTGTKKWEVWLGQMVETSPIVSQGTVYFGTSAGSGHKAVFALDANNGSRKWAFSFEIDFYAGPLVFGNTVIAGGSEYLFALDANNGDVRWTFKTSSSNESLYASPIAIDLQGQVFYPSISGLRN
jgi:outer membrane protein assembly factor BamB